MLKLATVLRKCCLVICYVGGRAFEMLNSKYIAFTPNCSEDILEMTIDKVYAFKVTGTFEAYVFLQLPTYRLCNQQYFRYSITLLITSSCIQHLCRCKETAYFWCSLENLIFHLSKISRNFF